MKQKASWADALGLIEEMVREIAYLKGENGRLRLERDKIVAQLAEVSAQLTILRQTYEH